VTARVLVVEDEATIRRAVGYALRRDGFDVEESGDGGHALALAGRDDGFDVVILDLGLPTVSGTEVLRRLRAAGPVPIIVLTAHGAESDRVLGLELGADDYVTKPFSMAELMSRVRAILRRCELEATRSDAVRTIGGVQIDLGRHQVRVDGHSVYLTGSQFKLLALLAEHPGEVVSRQAIMRRLWDSDYAGGEHVCDVHVSNLRHKIERDPSHPQRIMTLRGVGYVLVEV
jgi:two-component system response regulator RegX3